MRKTFTIAALTVAAFALGAGEASAQWRRQHTYPVYQTYTPTYTYNSGLQIATPITTVSGNSWAYGSQPVYTPNYYTPTYSNWGYSPTYSNYGWNNGWNGGWNNGYNGYNGFGVNNGLYLNSPVLQLGSAIRSWIR